MMARLGDGMRWMGRSAALCLTLTALMGCGGTGDQGQPGVDERGEEARVEHRRSVVGATWKEVSDRWRKRHDLLELAHFGVRDYGGSMIVDLGKAEATKHLNGGWRTGWNPTERKDGGEDYFEANAKSARIFFKHTKGGFDRIIVRMKAVKKSNKVVFYVNDKAAGDVKIDNTWKDYVVKVPKGASRDGENQLMLRFSAEAKVNGRKQAAHVAYARILAPGASATDIPTGPRVRSVDIEGVFHQALVARTPQTWTFRLQIPTGKPALGLVWGASIGGAEVKINVASDQSAPKEILQAKASGPGWKPEALDLTAWAGQVVEITMEAGGTWSADQVVAWGQPAIYSPATEAIKRPGQAPAKNVLIYLIDTMRYDKFSTYNPKTKTQTPNIDAFAKDATVFEHAYDNENWTKPSCATILTGLYPDTHKTKEDRSKLPASAVTISEHLKTKGFKTGSFIANGYVSNAFGFDQGWDYYTNYIRENKNTNADRLVDDTLNWIDKQKGKRFFAYVQTIDPHVPYSPPKKYRKLYWNRGYKGPIKPRSTGDQLAKIKTGKMDVNRDDKKYLEALYDGEVTFNDENFGRLIDGLKSRGLYDDTVIVIIADHGEEFFDHGKVGHGHSLYEEMIHSPLIVRYPGMATAGARVPHVVSMVDLVPSLLDIVDIPHHGALEGISFVDTLDGIGQPWPRIAVSDFLYRRKSFRAGRYKWITTGRGGELFDVWADRLDKKNVIKKHPIARAFVRTQAGVFMAAKDKRRWWRADNVGKPLKIEVGGDAEIDEELQKQLEAMGYVEGAKGDEEDNAKDDEQDDP